MFCRWLLAVATHKAPKCSLFVENKVCQTENRTPLAVWIRYFRGSNSIYAFIWLLFHNRQTIFSSLRSKVDAISGGSRRNCATCDWRRRHVTLRRSPPPFFITWLSPTKTTKNVSTEFLVKRRFLLIAHPPPSPHYSLICVNITYNYFNVPFSRVISNT